MCLVGPAQVARDNLRSLWSIQEAQVPSFERTGAHGVGDGISRLHDETVHIVTDSLDVIAPPPLTLTLTSEQAS